MRTFLSLLKQAQTLDEEVARLRRHPGDYGIAQRGDHVCAENVFHVTGLLAEVI
jgi:hypothetical protein